MRTIAKQEKKVGPVDHSGVNSQSALGFLTVVEHPQVGLFGGYLVLNRSGRPLEFHCTAPIKPNRAQEILYGPTLESFLYGEQIGRTLLEQAQASPLMVCTDRIPALTTREHADVPFALVLSEDSETKEKDLEQTFRVDQAHVCGPRLSYFQIGRNRMALPEGAGDDRRLIEERLADLAESFDLSEPFQRIRDAIEEARQAVR